MDLNLRLTTLDRLAEALSLPAATISIGHEACPHKLPEHAALMEAADAVLTQGKALMFVAPICHERFFQSVLERMAPLVSLEGITLVANDIGLLVAMAEQGWAEQCTIALGHGLSYSFGQQPWLALSLAEESEQVAGAFYQNRLNNPSLWEQFRAWGVQLIEVDSLPRASDSLRALRDAGFGLNLLLDVLPTAYARSCHTARYYQRTPPTCRACCDQPFQLTMTHRWHLFHDQIEPMPDPARAHVPDFTVYGNVVYQRAPEPDWSFIPEVEQVTLDIRFYTPDELQARIARLPLTQGQPS